MTARLYQPAKSSMTSGQGNASEWLIELAADVAHPKDPLMGWTGSTDTRSQLKLSFSSREAAQDYARKHGIAVQVEEPTKRRHRPRGYGDNFAYSRRVPWSH